MPITVMTGEVNSGKTPPGKYTAYQIITSTADNYTESFDRRWARQQRVRAFGAARSKGMIPGAEIFIAAFNDLPLRKGTILRYNTDLALLKEFPHFVVSVPVAGGGVMVEQCMMAECSLVPSME